MRDGTTQWRVSDDSRYMRCEYIGPQDFYFFIQQLKERQTPSGPIKLAFENIGSNNYLRPEREPELMRAFREALAIAQAWDDETKSAKP